MTEIYSIYKIESKASNKIYIGKTKDSLYDRHEKHCSAYNRRDKVSTGHSTVNEIFAEAEAFGCRTRITHVAGAFDKLNAVMLERQYIMQYRMEGRCVNKRVPNPAQCGKGSIGTAEYRKALYERKKQTKAFDDKLAEMSE